MERIAALNRQLSPAPCALPLGRAAEQAPGLTFEIPAGLKDLRARVLSFMETHVYPLEKVIFEDRGEGILRLREVQLEAKRQGLWAIGHPKELGGGGLPFMDYVFINEVQGRSEIGQICLGTYTLQDSLMLYQYASPRQRELYLSGIVAGEISPSFAMTEPDVVSSDPIQLQTRAVLDGDHWVINGHKWFTTNANFAAFTTVMCRTEFDPDISPYLSFSMIIVPTNTPGYNIIRDPPVLGIHSGHCEVKYENVRVPYDSLLGPRGHGFVIAQERLGPGRIFHCMRWLGQAQRAFDLMCNRLNTRMVRGEPLGRKQLMQKHVFDSYAEIQACRLLTLAAAQKIDKGEKARVEIAAIKVVGAHMLHNVIDRAVQVYGAAGLTDDTPLSLMYRTARFARIYDGPDEVHIKNAAARILMDYANGVTWDFGTR